MKSLPTQVLAPLLFTALLATPAFASADASLPADTAAQRLTTQGSIPVSQATSFVQPGTYRIQVTTKLGRPDTVLPDGTWLYDNRRIEGSAATGTLVVRFDRGRVSSLRLVTPTVATALIERARTPHGEGIVATK